MSIVDDLSALHSLSEGFVSIAPNLSLSFSASRGKRMRRKWEALLKARKEIAAAESKGNVGEVTKAMRKFVGLLIFEEKMGDKEERAETKLEMKIFEEFVETTMFMQVDAGMEERLLKLEYQFHDLASLQFAKLKYLEEGGNPWTGFSTEIGSYSEEQCINIIVTKFRDMRDLLVSIRRYLSKLRGLGARIKKLKNEKTPVIKRINDAKKEAETTLRDLEKNCKDMIAAIKFQFFVILRLEAFISQYIEEEEKHIASMRQKGLPETKEKLLNHILGKAKDKYQKVLGKDSEGAQKVINFSERAEVAAKHYKKMAESLKAA
ncbi:MAG: hypothetical protein KKE20_00870 [Nanoarchaeota archaeon]|nr:hypothetical protein [Nanoarchaeota archaeon]